MKTVHRTSNQRSAVADIVHRAGANRKRNSPLPWLALHIALFNDNCDAKTALAAARAALADRIYAASSPAAAGKFPLDTQRVP